MIHTEFIELITEAYQRFEDHSDYEELKDTVKKGFLYDCLINAWDRINKPNLDKPNITLMTFGTF